MYYLCPELWVTGISVALPHLWWFRDWLDQVGPLMCMALVRAQSRYSSVSHTVACCQRSTGCFCWYSKWGEMDIICGGPTWKPFCADFSSLFMQCHFAIKNCFVDERAVLHPWAARMQWTCSWKSSPQWWQSAMDIHLLMNIVISFFCDGGGPKCVAVPCVLQSLLSCRKWLDWSVQRRQLWNTGEQGACYSVKYLWVINY